MPGRRALVVGMSPRVVRPGSFARSMPPAATPDMRGDREYERHPAAGGGRGRAALAPMPAAGDRGVVDERLIVVGGERVGLSRREPGTHHGNRRHRTRRWCLHLQRGQVRATCIPQTLLGGRRSARSRAGFSTTIPSPRISRPGPLGRLAKIEGQVRGLSRMIEQDRSCIDVLTQISAVTKALQQAGLLLLDEHVRHCVLDAAEKGGDLAEQRFEELQATLRQALRL